MSDADSPTAIPQGTEPPRRAGPAEPRPAVAAAVAGGIGRAVRLFDWAFRPFRSHLLYCGVERPVRWFVGSVLLSGQIFLLVAVAWGVIGAEIGLTDLFWNESPGRQLWVGMATSWLFGTVLFVNVLLNGFAPDRLPDRPTDTGWTWRVYATMFPSCNPGVRRIGRWMLGWLVGLAAVVYGGKVVALEVAGYRAGERVERRVIEAEGRAADGLPGDEKRDPQEVRGEAGRSDSEGGGMAEWPHHGLLFLLGYASGLAAAYLLSLIDARLELRETLARQSWLILPEHLDRCRGDRPPPRTPAEGEPGFHQFHTLLLLHAMAVVLGLVILVTVLAVVVVPLVFFEGVQRSPVLILSLILMTLDVFGGLVAYRARGARTFAVVCLAVVMLFNWNAVVGHKMRFPEMDYSDLLVLDRRKDEPPEKAYARYRKEFADRVPEGGLIDPKAWLEKHRTDGAKGQRPKLVLIATSGGGVRAAVWTGVVLQELDGLEPAAGGARLRTHVRLIAGASGGMVGAAAYAGEFSTDPLGRKDFDADLGLYPLAKNLAKDSLTPVVQTMIAHDFTIGTLSPFWSRYDRGRTLEDAFDEHFGGAETSPFARPVRESKEAEEKGLRPALVFSPMLVEDSKRLLISNLDLGRLSFPRALAAGGPLRDLSLPAVEFFRLFPTATNFKVGTAARMSATFPVVSPAVGLPIQPVRRVVDAGYFDNYGVYLLAQWLLRHEAEVAANTSGVVLIQIRAYPLRRDGHDFTDVAQSPTDMAVGAVSAPLQALTTARGSAAHQRNGELLDVLHRVYNNRDGRPANFFATSVFELDGSAALSWYLTKWQKRRVAAGMYQLRAGAAITDDDPWARDKNGRPVIREDIRGRLDRLRDWFGTGGQ